MLRNFSLTMALMTLCHVNALCQKSFLKASFGITEAVGKKFTTKFGPGTEIAYLIRASKGFYLGLGMDYYTCEESGHSIHIPYNLASGERVYNRMNMFNVGLATYVDLSPGSRTKFFAGGRLGLRNVTSKTIHDGDALIFFAMEETLYEKRSLGPAAEFFLSGFIPLSSKEISPFGLELKCAYVAGNEVQFVSSKRVYYDETKDGLVVPSPSRAALNCISTSIAFVWNFN